MPKTTSRARLVVVICALVLLALPATSALAEEEAEEFSEVGNTLTTTEGEVLFTVPGGTVLCSSSPGTGKVASSSLVIVSFKTSECEGSLGKATASCTLAFKITRTAAIEKECDIKGTECEIEIPAAGNSSLSEVAYSTKKEETGALEAGVYVNLSGITYKASKSCEHDGIKSGEEGRIESLSGMQVEGMAAKPQPVFSLEGVSATKLGQIKAEAATSNVFKFANNTTVTCPKVKYLAKTVGLLNAAGEWAIVATENEYGGTNGCTSTFTGNPTATVELPGCEVVPLLMARNAMAEQPGSLVVFDKCPLKIKVGTCAITAWGELIDSKYSNATEGSIKIIKQKAEGTFRVAPVGCAGLANGKAGYSGENTLKGSVAGVAKNLQIKVP